MWKDFKASLKDLLRKPFSYLLKHCLVIKYESTDIWKFSMNPKILSGCVLLQHLSWYSFGKNSGVWFHVAVIIFFQQLCRLSLRSVQVSILSLGHVVMMIQTATTIKMDIMKRMVKKMIFIMMTMKKRMIVLMMIIVRDG